jgi:uncharacterized membrane protein (UPF0127 family)
MMSRVINKRNNKVLVQDLEWARTMKERLVGLIGRKSLECGRGLWIKRSGNSIHTCFMKFPIDVIFVNKKGLVKYAVKNIKPWKIVLTPLFFPTDCLELPAGTLDLNDTKVGDTVSVEN